MSRFPFKQGLVCPHANRFVDGCKHESVRVFSELNRLNVLECHHLLDSDDEFRLFQNEFYNCARLCQTFSERTRPKVFPFDTNSIIDMKHGIEEFSIENRVTWNSQCCIRHAKRSVNERANFLSIGKLATHKHMSNAVCFFAHDIRLRMKHREVYAFNRNRLRTWKPITIVRVP